MAAEAEVRIGSSDGDGIVKGGTAGHDGCGGEGAGLVELGDGAVDAWGEAEVVSVDDETGGHGFWVAMESREGAWAFFAEVMVGREGFEPPTSCL